MYAWEVTALPKSVLSLSCFGILLYQTVPVAFNMPHLMAVLEAFVSNILNKILFAVERKMDVIPTFNFVYRLTQPCPLLLVLQRQLDEFKHSLKVLVAELATVF